MPRKTTRPANASRKASHESGDSNDIVSRVYRELRELIVWGQLPPGARVAERTVAERLNVSRTPVRSALHRLQQEGYISSTGGPGEPRLIIAPMTREDGEELYLLLGNLEGLAARTAAELPAARRRALAARMREPNKELSLLLKERREVIRMFDLDLEFHRTFVEEVGGPRMIALHRALRPQIERYVRAYVGPLPDSVGEHEAMIRAISRGDGKAAQLATEANWQQATDRLVAIISEYGDRGAWQMGVSADVPGAVRRGGTSRIAVKRDR